MTLSMERTQIYLPKTLKKRLRQEAALASTNVSEVLRAAAEAYLQTNEQRHRAKKTQFKQALKRAAGIWKDRDVDEFAAIRRSADQRLEEWGA